MKTHPAAPVILALLTTPLTACSPDDTVVSGIAVGNPGTASLQTSRSADAPLLSAEAALAEARLVDCDGGDLVLAAQIAVSMDGSSQLLLPGGAWCGVGLSFHGPAVFRYAVGDGVLELQLDLGDLEATGPAFPVDGQPLVAQLGPAHLIDPTEWTVAAGEDLVIDPTHPDHDALAAATADWLVLAEDPDGDRLVAPDDPTLATTPAADPRSDDDDDNDIDDNDGDDGDDGDDESSS